MGFSIMYHGAQYPVYGVFVALALQLRGDYCIMAWTALLVPLYYIINSWVIAILQTDCLL